MGEWEGNYIYYGERRMKTTGGEYEGLLENVEKDGEKIDYRIIDGERREGGVEVISYYYDGDDAYYCVVYGAEQNCIIKYNIFTKEYKIIYYTEERSEFAIVIRIFRDNLMVVASGYYVESGYFILDHDGNVLQRIANGYKDYLYLDDYIVNFAGTKIEYRTWSDENFKTIADGFSKNATDIELYNNRFYITSRYVGANAVDSFYIYDISTGRLVTVFESQGGTSAKWIGLLGNRTDYYMTYNLIGIEYRAKGTTSTKPDGTTETPLLRSTLAVNCILYKINDDLSSTKLFVFDEKKDFSAATFFYGCLNFRVRSVQDDKNKYMKNESFYLDLQTLKIKRGERTLSRKEKNALPPKPLNEQFICGNYYYFMSESRHYFYLHRRDLETKKEQIMHYHRKGSQTEIFGDKDFKYWEIRAIRNY